METAVITDELFALATHVETEAPLDFDSAAEAFHHEKPGEWFEGGLGI